MLAAKPYSYGNLTSASTFTSPTSPSLEGNEIHLLHPHQVWPLPPLELFMTFSPQGILRGVPAWSSPLVLERLSQTSSCPGLGGT